VGQLSDADTNLTGLPAASPRRQTDPLAALIEKEWRDTRRLNMSRISTILLLSGALAVLALPASSASAGSLTTQRSKVTVHGPAPRKLNVATVAQYRNGAQYTMPRKLPGQSGFHPIILDRGLTSDRRFQQWKQGIGGTK
jgi:hypothetical protein